MIISRGRPFAFALSVAAALAVAFPLLAGEAVALKAGDPAPALQVGKWVKGDAVEKLEKGTIYVVECWATWCGPCRAIAPLVAEVAKDYDGRLTVAKMNVDENQATPAKYGIRGIPTLMLFKNGTVVGTRVGQLKKPELIAFIDSNL